MRNVLDVFNRKPEVASEKSSTLPPQQPINGQPSGLKPISKAKRKKVIIGTLIIIGAVIILAFIGVFTWAKVELSPASSDTQKRILVTIVNGSTSSEIGQLLQDKSVIRNATVFDLYTQLSGTKSKLQAGTYRLAPSESTPDIVQHLANGAVDTFSITFLPGATLQQDRQVLIDAGYSTAAVDQALSANYDSLLFQSKPSTANLEGYIYGQTYEFNAGASVSDILNRTFQEYYTELANNNIIAGIDAQGYTLFQGITLASIVQKEVPTPTNSNTPSSDQKQVAQVFYSRLGIGMPLGSDVTYQYAAVLLGVTPSPSLDSPYNTRLYAGLPPGPIDSPSLTALEAVASPASTNYLYFLSGDDGKTYFAQTEAEHQANITNYCQQKCSAEQ